MELNLDMPGMAKISLLVATERRSLGTPLRILRFFFGGASFSYAGVLKINRQESTTKSSKQYNKMGPNTSKLPTDSGNRKPPNDAKK